MAEEKRLTREELIKKAEKPSHDAMVLHPFYGGKYQIVPKCVVRSLDDFAIWYTPGVAAPCMDIYNNPETVYDHTNKKNTVFHKCIFAWTYRYSKSMFLDLFE